MLKINNTRRTLKTIYCPYPLLFIRNVIITQAYFINKNMQINTQEKINTRKCIVNRNKITNVTKKMLFIMVLTF